MKLIKKAGFDSPNEYCIVGPKIEDFSSTEERKALERRDIEGLRVMNLSARCCRTADLGRERDASLVQTSLAKAVPGPYQYCRIWLNSIAAEN